MDTLESHAGDSRLYLAPSEVAALYGWEHYKSEEIVEEYARRLLSGARFPPVEIIRYEGGFRLAHKLLPGSEKFDGGHYRSLAAMRAGKPLAVRLIEDDGALDRVRAYLLPLRDVVPISAQEDVLGFFKQDREERLRPLEERL